MVVGLMLGLGAGPATAGDLVLRSRVEASGRSAAGEVTQYWTAKRLIEDMDRVRVIADLEAQTITVMDKSAKIYDVRSFEEFRKIGDEVSEQLAQTRKRMAEMGPAERAKMPAMARAMAAMGEDGARGPAWTVEATGKSERIAGYAAKEYTVAAGTIHGTVWATDELKPPFSSESIAAFRATTRGMPRFGLNPIDLLERVGGVLLRSETILPGPDGVTVTMNVLEVKEESPPAEILDVPPGFTKGTAPGMPPAAGGAKPD